MTTTGKVEIAEEELRQILFWAAVGIRGSNGGSYQRTVCEIVNRLAAVIEYDQGEYAPIFAADLKGGAA